MTSNNKTSGSDDSESESGHSSVQEPLVNLIESFLATHPADGKRMTLKLFSERSGISVSNLSSIMSGQRQIAKSSRDFVEKLAKALEVPVLQIYILSGFITSSDVIYTASLDGTVEAIYRQMSADTRMSYRAPSPEVWSAWPVSAKLHICMMYEVILGRTLLRYANIEIPEVVSFLGDTKPLA